ncbi:ATP-binding cassette domain-containing protein [Nocardioides sp. B-3]|uniref:ATP-binding cassette domain-containing protein n=1 Tax=Nocardioides sp. B-3 TaxID=2895565 RepID=UPI002152C028|nr:ATP-binding cassette domain-containing protein [Nocardioides sp. B-3]UUZ61381.1 ATP-binding cassette domain-containing protein [Nocardioides sp. B-3]
MLQASNLEVVYDDVVLALRGVSVQIPDGAIVALLGANGAGKSTLLRALTGLLDIHDGEITKGRVSLDDRPLNDMKPEKIVTAGVRRVLEGRRLFVELSVEENLKVGAHTARAEMAANLERVYALFPKLADRRAQTAGYLSGGEQQMVAMGRALMSGPRYLLLDEPTPGPGAADGRGDPRRHRHDQRVRHRDPAGRAERHHGAVRRSARLRHGERPRRARQARRRAAAQRRRPRVLPRPPSRRGRSQVVPRDQALPTQEEVVGMTGPVARVDNVRLTFKGVTAIDGVSFEVHPDELFAIIGPNGAGKTSLFNVLSGVYRPQEGSVEFLGENILGRRPFEIASRGMARTFQNIALFEHLTVIDNLMLGRHQHIKYGPAASIVWRGRARREEIEHRAYVEEIVDFPELLQWRSMPVGLLPYGVQKRVELGRALAMEPKLLLLDEPVAGMNLEETEDTARFILDIRDELHVPIIMVEHDMGLVMDLADRVMVVDFGIPITTGTPAQVQTHPDVIRAYLGEEVSK